MRRSFLCLIVLLTLIGCTFPAHAANVVRTATVNIAASDQTIALGGTFSYVTVYTSSGASTVYLDMNDNTATSADSPLEGGSAYKYVAGQGISSFHYLGAGTTGTLTWIASNAEIDVKPPGGSGGGGGAASAVYGADGATAMSPTNPFVVSDDASANSAANPMHFQPSIAGAANSATNGMFVNPLQGNAVLSATNGIFSNLLQGNAVLSATNPIFVTPTIAGAVNSATNGHYINLLHGNAVISATNGIFSNVLQGNAVLSATNGIFANILKGNAAISASNPLQTQVIVNGNAVAAATPIPVSATEAANTAANPIHAQIAVAGTTVGTANPVPVSATTGANAVGNTIFVSPVQAGAAVGVGNPMYIQGTVTASLGATGDYYSASSAYTTPAAATTDMLTVTGSGTKTIKIKYIGLDHIATAGAAASPFFLIKRSTAGSGGTATTETNVPNDSADAAGTATVKTFTANPTVGTIIARIVSGSTVPHNNSGATGSPSGTVAATTVVWDSTKQGDIVLRGTSEQVAVNWNGVIPTGTTPTISYTVQWTEEGLYPGAILVAIDMLAKYRRRRQRRLLEKELQRGMVA